MALDSNLAENSLSQVIASVSKDKNLDKNVIVDALEQAMIHAARKTFGVEADLEAHYNEESDEIELYQFRTVVEDDDVANPEIEIALEDALKLDSEAILGDSIGVKVKTNSFGRIASQSAKQIIVQKIKMAEKTQVYDEFKGRVGEILSGTIRRMERGDIIVDLGKTEAVLPVREQVPTEKFRVKDRIQGFVLEVKRSAKGPQVILSRAHPGFLVSLFEHVVTEIYDGIVSIEGAARDPGNRSKIAVYSKDASVDPIGACVGMKGQRVQSIVQELNGEKIDIVPWDRDPAKLVCNALAPAVVSKVIVDEENHGMEVIVPIDQLSLAIGKKGQNVKLAAQLTGWKLDIKSEAKLEQEMSNIKEMLASIEGITELFAGILIHEGYTTASQIAELSPRALARMLNLESQEEAEKIIKAASEFDEASFEEEQEQKAETAEENLTEEEKELLDNSYVDPTKFKIAKVGGNSESEGQDKGYSSDRDDKIAMFSKLYGVGEAAAHALADAGYVAIGDILADSLDELSSKINMPLTVARTIQIAADKFLQEERASSKKED